MNLECNGCQRRPWHLIYLGRPCDFHHLPVSISSQPLDESTMPLDEPTLETIYVKLELT